MGTRPTALITGASGGIGLELARAAAGDGHDLVLVARSADRLESLATELRDGGGDVLVVPADLGAVDGAAVVCDALGDRAVDVLVNNAGYATWGPFDESDRAEQLGMIDLNVRALTELTHRLLPAMVHRRRGRILNVASTAAFFPGPLMAVYYATKNYVLAFSEALAEELDGSGVTVTALCPGPTESGFQARAAMEESKLVKGRKIMAATPVAKAGWDGCRAGKRVVVPGPKNVALALMPRFLPRRLVARSVRNAQRAGH